jgi:hypothetical protein
MPVTLYETGVVTENWRQHYATIWRIVALLAACLRHGRFSPSSENGAFLSLSELSGS